MKTIFSLLVLLLAFDASAATYFVDWVAGNDANNGLTKTAPWKRNPKMNGFVGTYSHANGDRFIHKGGVTWPRAAFNMNINVGGGSEATRDYYGSDQTWYTGGAWARPVFDGEHTVISWGVNGSLIQHSAGSYITIDGIDVKNVAGKVGGGNYGTMSIVASGGSFMTVTNCIMRDWLVLQADNTPYPNYTMSGWDQNGIGGIGAFVSAPGTKVTHSVFHQDGVSQKSGCSIRNFPKVQYCEVRNTTQAVLGGGSAEYCWFHNMPRPSDTAAHANAIQSFANAYIIGNVIHDLYGAVTPITLASDWGDYTGSPRTGYVINNIMWNLGGQTPIGFQTSGNPSGCSYYVWNNTVKDDTTWPIRTQPGITTPWKLVDARNNHFITPLSQFYTFSPPNGSPVATFINESNLLHTASQATTLGYTIGNHFAPLDATKPTVGKGINLSAFFTVDNSGATRTVPWDIGAHEYGSTISGPGVLVFANSEQNVTEEDGNVTIIVYRTSGNTGAVSCYWSTDEGTALQGVNYVTQSGTLSWAAGNTDPKVLQVPLIDQNMAENLSFTINIVLPTGGATLGTPNVHTVNIQGTGEPAPPAPLTGWTWAATNASSISAPFFVTGDYVSQGSQILDPALAGEMRFVFTNSAGIFRPYTEVDAASGSSDSAYVSFNIQPVAPANEWHVIPTPTVGFETRDIGNRGSGGITIPEFPILYATLAEGTNTLIIRGRESGLKIRTVWIENVTPPVEPDTPAQVAYFEKVNLPAYAKAGDVLSLKVRFSTNVTLTGAATLGLNNLKSFTAAAVSDTNSVLFTYTVATGDDVAGLDYAGTGSLSGDFANGAATTDLTLPAPGPTGLLQSLQAVTVDTIAPTVSIASPGINTVTNQVDISYGITFDDANFDKSLLSAASDIEVLTTGSISYNLTTSSGIGKIQTVLVTVVRGLGTLRIAVKPGKAMDLAGNLAPASAYSDNVSVEVLEGSRILIINTTDIQRILVTQ